MVDWSTIPKIDAHIHLMPPDVIEANQGLSLIHISEPTRH